MSEVDFSDIEQAKAWFEKQSHEMRCTMASRSALRTIALVGRMQNPPLRTRVLLALRSIITSATCGLKQASDSREELRVAAASAARAFNGPGFYAAATAAEKNVTRSAEAAAASAAANGSASVADYFAHQTDVMFKPEHLSSSAVWLDPPAPEEVFLAHGVFFAEPIPTSGLGLLGELLSRDVEWNVPRLGSGR
ncbi:hypothetical protein [uncultured Tateyamaria sp.]|uniref:hypothetical protein n=1 Tax=uncultured Tateyamaria sp. TaxID=455651 RepID=UPI00262EF534|nr:hypothetical protein [uncultured Tateyamaria sp.]